METPQLVVLAYTSDPWESACPTLRIVGPCWQGGINLIQGTNWDADRLDVALDSISEADLIVIQRDFPHWQDAYQEIMGRARALRKPVVYELDDWLLGLPEEHPDYRHYRSTRAAMLAAIVEADGVTASTATLCEYLGRYNPRTWLLPNCLDDRLWIPRQTPPVDNPDQIVIGYMEGTTQSHSLELIAPALTRVLQRFGDRVRLQCWGQALLPPSLAGHLNVARDDRRYLDYAMFAAHFSKQTPDIVLAPLRGDAFGQAKSAIKFLEYSALGAAGIYSAVTPYIEVVNDENGVLASTVEDWERSLVELIEDPVRRRRLGQNARQTVQEHWMLSQHAHKWAQCYRTVAQNGKVAPEAAVPEFVLRVLQGWEEQSEARLAAREALLQTLVGQTARQAEVIRSQEAELQRMRRSITWRGTEPARQAFVRLRTFQARLVKRPPHSAAVPQDAVLAAATIGPDITPAMGNVKGQSDRLAVYQNVRFFWDDKRYMAVSAQLSSDNTDIIVCVGKNASMAQRCVASIKRHTDHAAYRLNLVVHEQDVSGLPESLRAGTCIVTHALDIFNFAIANNLALAQCPPRGDVVLLNDDTEVTPGWLEKLQLDSRGVALTGARTGHQCSGNPDMWGEGERRLTWYPINMFCAYIPGRVREIIGGLDEEFFYYGGEDVDYSCRALQNGFPLVVSSAFVHHAGNQTFQGAKERLMQESDKILLERYGLIPPFDLSAIKPKVSVITTTRNRAEPLQAAAHSILGGLYPEIELIVVDGNSSDETVKAIQDLQRADQRVIGVRLAQPPGDVNSRREGIDLSQGQFIAFMDDDGVAWPNRVLAPLEWLLMRPELDAVYCGFDIVSESGRRRGRTGPFDVEDYLNMNLAIGSGTLLLRRKTIVEVPFMTYYDRAIDYDWVFRLVRRGYRIDYCPTVVLDINGHGSAEQHLARNAAAEQQRKMIQERENLMKGLRRK
jgi:processive 1,2-diacylglycerol beta-glucosyltransferase